MGNEKSAAINQQEMKIKSGKHFTTFVEVNKFTFENFYNVSSEEIIKPPQHNLGFVETT